MSMRVIKEVEGRFERRAFSLDAHQYRNEISVFEKNSLKYRIWRFLGNFFAVLVIEYIWCFEKSFNIRIQSALGGLPLVRQRLIPEGRIVSLCYGKMKITEKIIIQREMTGKFQ
jgi:hypothetical protein